jgi:hypothetical protein
MPALVQEQKQNKSNRPFPSPDARVNADHQNHRAAGFEQNWQDKLDLADEFQDDDADHADWAERFFYLASGRFAWRQRARVSWIGNQGHTDNIKRVATATRPRRVQDLLVHREARVTADSRRR